MADTESLPTVRSDCTVCGSHKDMLTRKDFFSFAGLLLAALAAIGGVFFARAASAERVDRNESDIKDLRVEVRDELRLMRQEIQALSRSRQP